MKVKLFWWGGLHLFCICFIVLGTNELCKILSNYNELKLVPGLGNYISILNKIMATAQFFKVNFRKYGKTT